MGYRLAAVAAIWLLTGITAQAADFWEEKDFSLWSSKEVTKMLTDSPWSKQVRIIVSGGLSEGGPPQLQSPNFDDCGGGQFGRIQRAKVTISWASALPFKQAQVRQVTGLDNPISAAGQQVLDRPEPAYVVTITDLPMAFGWLTGMGEVLKNETMLRRKNKAAITPVDVRLFQSAGGDSLTLVIQFPKIDPITLDDKDVEVVTKLGNDEIKKKFKLADMVFDGQLAL